MGGPSRAETVTEMFIGHPNFVVPPLPKGQDGIVSPDAEQIMEWTLRCVAMLVSPPKEDDEDNDFECDEVRDTVLGPLRELLKQQLTQN